MATREKSEIAAIHTSNQFESHQESDATSFIKDGSQSSATSEIAPYGALQPLIEDRDIEEIWINSPQRIYIARGGKSELTNIVLT